MRTTFRIVFSLVLVVCAFSIACAQQPRRVLFETFTNSYDLCPEANGLDAAFKQTLASANGSKVIHLNQHITNVGDPMVVANGASSIQEMIRLSHGAFPYPIFNGAVDHTVFSSTDMRITSKYEPSGATEWNNRINERVGDLPLVAITLSDAKLDKIGQSNYWRLIAKIKVTLQDQNSDSLRLFYAITEDGVYYKQCETTKPVVVTNHDNVVRFIDASGIPLALKNMNAGASDEVTITHDISKTASYGYELSKMKLIAFVERGTYDNYEVVQAWELRKNFDTLVAPPSAITISNETLDGKSYAPEDNILITFDKTNVDSVKLEYSTNNGSTWQLIENINNNVYFWKAPDITTTQGKIRVSELKTGTPSAISTGHFTIAVPLKRITIIKPQGGDTAYLTKKLTIQWSKTGSEIIEKVDLDYSVNGGASWAILAKNQTGTSFTWNLYGSIPVTEQALVRITEVTDSVVKLSVTSDPFYIMEPSTGKVKSSKIISGVWLYPQPVEKGKALTVELVLDAPDKVDFTIFDIMGKEVYSEKAHQMIEGSQSNSIELPILSSGSYILTIRDSQGGHVSKLIEVR
jgi:type IX secretion system substrate protein